MSFHHWMYFGCQCSSARCSRLLPDRLTLFGIFSAEIISTPRSRGHQGPPRTQRIHLRPAPSSLCPLSPWCPVGARAFSCAPPVEFRPSLLAVDLQCAFFTDGVGALEDPVLPRGQPAEDLRLHGLRP